ncbi:hypothetical protein [Streptomyces hygroscopicus]|nr:hypothetical protein [Streptomyces hygroscopicus]
MIGANSQPCILPAGHSEEHRNACGVHWAATTESAAISIARAALAKADALDFADTRAMAAAVGSLREALRMVLEGVES